MIQLFDTVRQRADTGALKFVTLCFLAAFVARLSVSAPALSDEVSALMDGQTDGATEMLAPQSLSNEETDLLLAKIREREAQLDAEAQRIEARLKVLEIAQQQYDQQLKALIEAEEALAATMSLADQAASRDIGQLTSVYENMKAKNAAKIFDAMDVNFAAGFLSRMAPQAAAEILSAMNTDAAYSVSLAIANLARANAAVVKEN